MMIFWRAGLAVLAVPKTGSEALQEVLWPHADVGIRFPPTLRHMNRLSFENRVMPALSLDGGARLETVAVVRDPEDWLASWYRYRTRPDIRGTPASTRDVPFDAFVEAWLSDTPPEFARVGRQSRFCAGPGGAPAIDHLFAYEAPRALHRFLESRLGVPVAPGRRNVSPRVEATLSKDLRQRLHAEARAEYRLHAGALR